MDGPALVLDFVPPKGVSQAARLAKSVTLALWLVMVSDIDARADQAPVAPLPMSTAEAPQQCCRICRKGQACGDRCMSATKQCKKGQGCACSAAGSS
jgi:hypothetical protein